MSRSANRAMFLDAVAKTFGDIDVITRAQIVSVCEQNNLTWPAWFVNDDANRVGRGMYSLKGSAVNVPDMKVTKAPVVRKTVQSEVKVESVPQMNDAEMAAALHTAEVHTLNLVPAKVSGYVPFGNFNDVRSIVKSRKFYPMYITGLSGNGKTMMVEQVHAQEGRELIRVNVTIETDEDDLIGGFRLVDGRTVWQNGPVVIAMERGATLLLDEVDLGSTKMMCLQPVMEGKAIFIKKINRVVYPAPGFNVIATANTKGKGSDDGRFIGTNVQNEAMLDRYAITLEQTYPAPKVEGKILNNVLAAAGVEDKDFVEKLVLWADIVRRSFESGALSEIISTRRLVNICDAFLIFKNRQKAIELCVNRFDVDTKNAFLDLYNKLDADTAPVTPDVPADEEVAF